jgi:hypothetical protein
MEIQNNLCINAIRKVALLITKAIDLGMDLSDYVEAGENPSNGNVYLWAQDYGFVLYIPLCADDRIHACWSSVYTDEEETIAIDGMSLRALEDWAYDLTEQAERAFA